MANSELIAKLFDLSGKVAVVTGGNRGIGRGIALALAGAGAAVAIMARDEEKNRATLADVRALGVPGMALRVDLAERAALQPALDEIERTLGPINILVNNAAFAILKGVLEQTVDEWDSVMAVNLDAPFVLAKSVAQAMVRRGAGGKIINVSSIAGNAGSPIFPSYVTAKGGLQALTRCLALDLRAPQYPGQCVAARMVQHRHDGLDPQLAGIRRSAQGDGAAHAARPLWRAGGAGGCGGLPRFERVGSHDGRRTDYRRRLLGPLVSLDETGGSMMANIYRAEVIGSLLRPAWLKQARLDYGANRLSTAQFKQLEDRAVDEALALQVASGVDVVTDGEMRRSGFVGPLTDYVEGFTALGLDTRRWHTPADAETDLIVPVTVTGKLRRRRSLAAEEFTYARARATAPLKVTLPSPLMLALRYSPELSGAAYPDPFELFADAVDILTG